MSTENLHSANAGSAEPVHADVSFEKRDVSASNIYRYLGALAVSVILTYIVCVYILRFTVHEVAKSDTPLPPISAELGPNSREVPPEPRLQGIPGHPSDPQSDRRLKFEADREALEKSGWMDEKLGIAQIPIEDAMKMVAEKGLSGSSSPGSSTEKKK